MALDSSPDKIRFVAKPGSNPSREVDVPIFPPPPLISPVPPPSPPQPSMPRLRSYFPSDRLDRLRSHPSLAWFSSALLVDWLVAIALGAASTWVERQYPFKRDVTHYLSDPSVSWPHAAHERVPAGPGSLLDLLTFYLPLLVLVLVSALRLSLHEMHHAVLALFSSRAIMRIVVECVKNRVGKLRPDFLDRCAWDAMEGVCTGAAALVKDGRRSFPSGHSATSLQGLGLLALFLAGKNGAFAFDASFPRSTLLQSRLLRFSIAVSPLFLAGWICITRIEDNYHHAADVLAGSAIGILSALVVYLIYFPNPFDSSKLGIMDRAKVVYGAQEEARIELMGEEEGLVRREEVEEV